MKKLHIFLLLLLPLCAMAETEDDREAMRHEVRVGWGDQLFETLLWHEPTSITSGYDGERDFRYNEDYHYSQHWFVEYQYRVNRWFGAGVMIDNSAVDWDVVTRDGHANELSRDKRHYFYNIVAMPTLRFTYFHHPYVNLYSGLGFGLCVNGGTETNEAGQHTVAAAAGNLTLLGVSANYQRFFASFELGGMVALSGMNTVYMFGSRLMTFSLGCRF